jgi:hypothetical protein
MALRRLADRNLRPISAEVRLAIAAHLKASPASAAAPGSETHAGGRDDRAA